MPESYFTKVANEILDASEKIVNRFEEGLNILLGELDDSSGTKASPADVGNGQTPPESLEDEFEGWDGEEDMDDPSPLEGIAQSVMGDIMAGQKTPETFMEQLDAFRYAITWTEPFIVGMIVFQVVMLCLSFYVGRRDVGLAPRIFMLLSIGILVRSAEYLNRQASLQWETFCTQNYFDHRGIFISIFLSGPLLLDSMIMLLFFMREAAQLLVQVKKAEIKQKRAAATTANKAARRGKKDQ